MSASSTASLDDHLGLSVAERDAVTALLAYREREEVAAEAAVADVSTVSVVAEVSRDAIDAAACVSDRAFQLIVNDETGGKPYYEWLIKRARSSRRPISSLPR